jgi:hypothetical protein
MYAELAGISYTTSYKFYVRVVLVYIMDHRASPT